MDRPFVVVNVHDLICVVFVFHVDHLDVIITFDNKRAVEKSPVESKLVGAYSRIDPIGFQPFAVIGRDDKKLVQALFDCWLGDCTSGSGYESNSVQAR